MLADALGRTVRFIVTAGQTCDVTQAEALREKARRPAMPF